MKEKYIKYIRLFMPIIVGFIIGYLSRLNINYDNMIKPILFPPKIVFPIAWSIIYLLIGLSYMLYREKYNNKETIYTYYINLFLNFMWPITFYIFRLGIFSNILLVLIIISTIVLMYKYYKENKISTYLLIPYIIWLSYAFYLSIGLYILNK